MKGIFSYFKKNQSIGAKEMKTLKTVYYMFSIHSLTNIRKISTECRDEEGAIISSASF